MYSPKTFISIEKIHRITTENRKNIEQNKRIPFRYLYFKDQFNNMLGIGQTSIKREQKLDSFLLISKMKDFPDVFLRSIEC